MKWIVLGAALALSLASLASAGQSDAPTPAHPSKVHRDHALQARQSKAQIIAINVTEQGFEPALVKVKARAPLKLVVTRKVERTCATEIVIKDFNIKKDLPLNTPVEVSFTPTKPGLVRYTCAMDMIAGVLEVH